MIILKRYAVYIYTVIIAIFLATLAASIANYLLVSKPMDNTTHALNTQAKKSNTAMLTNITNKNMFGIDLVVPIDEPAVEDNQNSGDESDGITNIKPASAFSGKLTGILLGKTEDENLVIITVDNDIYVLSSGQVVDGYTLVKADFISAIIGHNKDYYRLELEGSDVAYSVSSANRFERRDPTATPPGKEAEADPIEEQQSTSETFIVARSEIVEQLKDINNLIRTTPVTPYYVDQKFEGYRIARVLEGSPVKLLGMEQGDIVQRINGEALSNPEQLFVLLNDVGTINAVTIDIERGGEKKTLFVEIQ